MKDHTPFGLGAYDSDPDEEFLVEQDGHIQAEARKAVPSNLFSEEILDLETDELMQNMRIKLWVARQSRSIIHPKAYIRTIAYTAAIDMVRRHRPTVPLLGDADGELSLGDLLVTQGKGFQDPADEIESEEIDADFLAKLVEALLALPPRQRQAMLYALKDRKDDALPLLNALKVHGIDIEAMGWPDEDHEVHLLKASLAVARKKLQWLLAEFMEV